MKIIATQKDHKELEAVFSFFSPSLPLHYNQQLANNFE